MLMPFSVSFITALYSYRYYSNNRDTINSVYINYKLSYLRQIVKLSEYIGYVSNESMELWRKIVLGDTYDDKGKEFMLTLVNFLDRLTLINLVYYKEEFTRKLLVYLLFINNFLFIVNVLMMFTRLFIDLSSLMWGINIVILFTFYYWKNYINKLLDFKKIFD
jgi:hypothetical protein